MEKALETLNEIIRIGRIEKEIIVSPNLKIVLSTLTMKETLEAVKETQGIEDNIVKFNVLQLAILKQAIRSVNGKEMTKEEKIELLENLQEIVFRRIYDEYLAIQDEQTKILDSLKKK